MREKPTAKKGRAFKGSGAFKKLKRGRPKGVPNYPRHDVEKALRIPRAILDQNAGKPCSEKEAI